MSTALPAQPVSSAGDQAASEVQLTWLRRTWIALILAIGSSVMAMNIADPDLWGHSLYGREWIENGKLAATTTGSFTSIGFRWINHENLAELLSAWVEMRFGPIGLTLGKFALSLMVLGLILFQARRRNVGWGVAGAAAILAAHGLAFHWHFRPQILGYALFTFMIVSLSWIFEGWEGRWNLRHWKALPKFDHEGVDYHWKRMRCLWLAFPFFAIWTNTHGSFAAGVAVFGAYLVFRSIEAACQWGWGAEGRIRRFALMCLAALLGTCATPYYLELHKWMLNAIGHPQPEIADWQPLVLLSTDGVVFGTLLLVTVVSYQRSRLPKDFTQIAILLLVGWQAVSHVRHLTFLAILVALWIPPHLHSTWQRIFQHTKTENVPLRAEFVKWAIAGMLLAISFIGGLTAPSLVRVDVDRSYYPVSAMQFMEDEHLRGRTVVTFNWAQYALACFAQEPDPLSRSTVAIDGRYTTCYSPETIDIYFDFIFGKNYKGPRYRSPRSGPINPEKALTHCSPELFVISRKQQSTVLTMEAHQDQWTLLYQDSLAQIWGLRSRFDDPQSRDYLPPHRRSITDAPQQGRAAYPALPVSRIPVQSAWR